MKMRLGYLAKPKDELIAHLKEMESDLDEYFIQNYVVITDELEYEEYFEGWKNRVIEQAKDHFIKDTVLELDYTQEELISIFGAFENNVQLFDLWWQFEETDISQMATCWQKT